MMTIWKLTVRVNTAVRHVAGYLQANERFTGMSKNTTPSISTARTATVFLAPQTNLKEPPQESSRKYNS